MAYQVLARKYRPQRFADVAGQDHVTVTLMNALTQDRIAHGYIFSGHRGIGKTTIARILACALNCRNPIGSELRPTAEPCLICDSCTEIRAGNAVDVIEIDAATNRGIDEIRELRDAARYRPSRDRFKIYILDEAHQITDAAFNALLKTLEEPPDHIVFMMATTQPEDIPQTVRSRCQHFSFHAVKLVDILAELQGIAEHEGVDADPGALALLAEAGDGSMRDALSIMDQAIASAPVEEGRARLDAAQIRELMGSVPNAVFERVMQAVDGNRSAEVIAVANDLLDAGNSPAQLARQAVRYLRSCVIAKIVGLTPDNGSTELLQISADEQRRAARTAALFTEEELTRFLQVMLRTFDELGYRQEQRFHFELGLLKLVHLRRLLPVEEVLSSLGGKPAATRPAASVPSRPAPPPAAQPAAAKPAFSPFERDSQRRRYDNIVAAAPVASVPVTPPPVATAPPSASAPVPVAPPPSPLTPDTAPMPLAASEPIPVPAAVPVPAPVPLTVPSRTEERAETSPDVPTPPPVFEPEASRPAPAPLLDQHIDEAAVALQRAAVDALLTAGQGAAADALSDSVWTRDGSEASVQTEVSKTMLPVVINPEAEKIARAAVRELGIVKLSLLPGVSSARAGGAKKPRTAKPGSAQSKAMEHPMVQQAQKLFSAEIQTVIDLSE